MSLSEKTILTYWRDSIHDAILMSPTRNSDASVVETAAVLAGGIDRAVAARLFEEWKKEASKKNKYARRTQDEEPPPQTISVLAAPCLYQWSETTREKSSEPVSAVWIPALMDRDGNLQADPAYSPWIAREMLEPSEKGDLVIGTIEDYLSAFREMPYKGQSWQEAIDFIKTLFKTVAGEELEEWIPRNYRRDKATVILRPDPLSDIKTRMMELCGRWLEKVPALPKLLKAALNPDGIKAEPVSGGAESFAHHGHLGAHGLNDEQRAVVRHALRLGDGQALAVNGPPGTGKTSVLQGVIASLIVRAACEGKQEPPIILATSTNNIAVTNVIDSFTTQAEPSDGDPLKRHWLPDIRSISVWIPNQKADREKTPYQKINEIRETIFAPETLTARQAHFLNECRQWNTGAGDSLDTAIATLRGALLETVGQIEEQEKTLALLASLPGKTLTAKEQALATRRLEMLRQRDDSIHALRDAQEKLRRLRMADAATPWHFVLFSFLPPIRLHRAKKLSLTGQDIGIPAIDPNTDYASCDAILESAKNWLAATEAQRGPVRDAALRALEEEDAALLRIEAYKKTGGIGADAVLDTRAELQKLDTTLRVRAFYLALHYWEAVFLSRAEKWKREGWDRALPAEKREMLKTMAMITPCFVATVFMAIKLFDRWEKGRSEPLEEIIDLLIFDESGQTGPELGLPLLGLARRALAVGDTQQLEPISISDMSDDSRLRHNQIGSQDAQWLKQRGLTCSKGNVMLAFHRMTAFTDGYEMPGIMLRDHYRCLPEIIRYCDDLAYGGLLRPVRAPQPDSPFPAMGYAHIRGSAEKSGSSWSNELEARTIADWLHQNRNDIIAWANGPSNGQKKSIEQIVAIITPYRTQAALLRNEIKKKLALDYEQLKNFTINTVHSLQGAERDMVIFSPVVRAGGGVTPLHERNRSLLNVAVSRARNSFLVFGDMELFREGSRGPSSLLARHLYRREENQLADIIPSHGYLGGLLKEQVLSGATQHEQMLHEILLQAKERILISSPFLSAAALTDSVLALMQAAIARGVKLYVATDSAFDMQQGQLRESARSARNRLQEAGATVWVVDKIHSKTLCMDGELLIEGSFNWLSASREAQWARTERSLVSRNEYKTPSYVDAAWKEMEAKQRLEWPFE